MSVDRKSDLTGEAANAASPEAAPGQRQGPWGQHAPDAEAEAMLVLDDYLQRFGLKGILAIGFDRASHAMHPRLQLFKRGVFSPLEEAAALARCAGDWVASAPAHMRMEMCTALVDMLTRAACKAAAMSAEVKVAERPPAATATKP